MTKRCSWWGEQPAGFACELRAEREALEAEDDEDELEEEEEVHAD